MKKYCRFFAYLLLAGMLCPLFSPCLARAAEELYPVTTTKNTSGNLYVNRFDGTSYQYITSIENNSSASAVSIYVSSEEYSLSAETNAISGAAVSKVGNLIRYTVTSSGRHSVKITAPQISGSTDRPYNYFNFTISSNTSSNTTTTTTTKSNAATQISLTEVAVSAVLYKEKFSNNDAWSFSTNIKNGGSTINPVVFTFPSSLKFSVTKNGSPIAYSSGASIANIGTYSVKISASDGGAEYYAVFSFTITAKPTTATTKAPTIATTRPAATTSKYTTTTKRATTATTKPSVTATTVKTSSVKASLSETANANGTYTEMLNSESSWSFTAPVKNGGTATSAVSFSVPSTMKLSLMRGNAATAYTSGTKISASGTYTMRASAVKGISEYYALFTFTIKLPETEKTVQTTLTEADTGDGRYKQTFKADASFSFISSVKNGASVTKSVQITKPSNLAFEILKNGVPVTGSSFAAAGTYNIKITAKKGATTYYSVFSFTIKDTSAPVVTTQTAAVKPVYTLKETTIFETQNADGTFTEKLNGNNAWAFISNISNGAISNVPVKLTIPTTMSFTVSRDGQPIAYASGGTLNVLGDYTVKVTGRSGSNEYYAYFMFRIEQKNSGSELLQTMLIESYNSDGTYSEKLNNNENWTFFSNVQNNGVSAVPVKFTVPELMSFAVSKDGQEIPYTRGAALSETGSYSVKTSVTNGQTEYYALFYFEILSQNQAADGQTADKKEIIKTINYNMTVKRGEEFAVNDAETYIIKDGGKITVESGGTLRVKKGGTIQINESGNIHIKINASYFIDDGGTMQVDGGTLQIDSEQETAEKVTEDTLILGEERVIPSGKLLIVESGAVLTVADASSLKIENGGALIVKSGASVIINEGGALNKQPNGIIEVNNGGIISSSNYEAEETENKDITEITKNITVPSGEVYNISEYSAVVIRKGVSVTVEKGGKFNLSKNAELSIENGGALKINKGGKLNLEEASVINAFDGGTLSVENARSDIQIADGAKICLGKIQDSETANTEISSAFNIKSGQTFNIKKNDVFTAKSGAQVNIQTGAGLNIESGAAFSIEQGALLSDSNLIVDESGKLTGDASESNIWYTYFSKSKNSLGNGNYSCGKLVVDGGGLINLTNSGKIYVNTGAYLYNNGTINMQSEADISGIANVIGTGNVWYGNGSSYDISSGVGLNLFENVSTDTDTDTISNDELARLLANLRQKYVPANTMAFRGFVSEYDQAMKMFKITFDSGDAFYCSVADSMTANKYIRFSFDEALKNQEIEVYLNDAKIEYTPGETLSEHGFYRMVFPNEANGEIIPTFTFSVINRPANNVHLLTAPDGFIFTGVTVGDEYRNIFSSTYLLSENTYEFVLQNIEDENLSFTFSVTRDVTAPKFELFGIERGQSVLSEITVVQNSDDVYEINLYDKNNNPVKNFDGEIIKNAGKYKIYVSDMAGNVSFEQFDLTYRMNSATIATVVAVVFFLAIAVGAAIYSRRNVRVR